MIVTLSTGEEVHISDHYGRKAMRAYNTALDVQVGSKSIPLENFNIAAEAAMPFMIEKIKAGEVEKQFSREWLDALDMADFEKLVEGISTVRRAADKDKKK